MHSPSVSRKPMTCNEGYGAMNRLYPLVSRSVTQLDLGVNLFCLHCCLILSFAMSGKLVSPSLHLFRWLKGSARDFRGTQAARSKKKDKVMQGVASELVCLHCCFVWWMFLQFIWKVRKVRLFTYFADWRAPPATFVACKQRTAKKRVWPQCSSLNDNEICSPLRTVRRADESSKLSIIAPYNDTTQNLTDIWALPPPCSPLHFALSTSLVSREVGHLIALLPTACHKLLLHNFFFFFVAVFAWAPFA